MANITAGYVDSSTISIVGPIIFGSAVFICLVSICCMFVTLDSNLLPRVVRHVRRSRLPIPQQLRRHADAVVLRGQHSWFSHHLRDAAGYGLHSALFAAASVGAASVGAAAPPPLKTEKLAGLNA